MLLSILAAFASDSGIQRVYDQQIVCEHAVDPAPDASTCKRVVRTTPPDDDHPTWAVVIAPPGKLYVSLHAPDVDWGQVVQLGSPRAFDPILLSAGTVLDEVCGGEPLQYAHLHSERGPGTLQACITPPWKTTSEVLLTSHRKLPTGAWFPIWVQHPAEADKAADVRTWTVLQLFVAAEGSPPATPPRFPFSSVDVLRASVPPAVPPRVKKSAVVPEPVVE